MNSRGILTGLVWAFLVGSLIVAGGCGGGGGSPDLGAELGASLDANRANADLSASTCGNGKKDGRESDVDCGGPDCSPCAVGGACKFGSDCRGGLCIANKCSGPSCTDHVKNGDETDVDCGGACPACGTGRACAVTSDCQSALCTNLICAAPGCSDKVKNGTETDVDCGGGACEPCDRGLACATRSDCVSAVCDASTLKCVTCDDSQKNGGESDVDCGGDVCPVCAEAAVCNVDADCKSNRCFGGVCAACVQGADCTSGVCQQGTCAKFIVVGKVGNLTYVKVPVKGTMTDAHVYAACKAAGLTVGCQAQGNCRYNDNLCVPSQEPLCGNAMFALAQAVCGGRATPLSCPALFGLFQYMGHMWMQDSACGVDQNKWCAVGSQFSDRSALCVLP